MKKIKVAVVMGGNSSEREVSLMTGAGMIKNLDREKYEVVEVDFPKEKEKINGCDVVLLALHGRGGEDGQIQGYLETLGIKYTGCGVLTSALGMDKMIFRWIMERYSLPMAKLTNKVPCVVKPVDGGSSIGVTIVKKQSDLIKAIKEAKKYSKDVLVEEYLEGTEVSCGVLGNENVVALPVIEIVPDNGFYDYEAKYSDEGTRYFCPARISQVLTKKIQELSVEVFKAIKGRGYARIDFIIHKDEPYILEINSLPGMTPHSLIPQEARVAGMSYSQLLDRMIDLAA